MKRCRSEEEDKNNKRDKKDEWKRPEVLFHFLTLHCFCHVVPLSEKVLEYLAPKEDWPNPWKMLHEYDVPAWIDEYPEAIDALYKSMLTKSSKSSTSLVSILCQRGYLTLLQRCSVNTSITLCDWEKAMDEAARHGHLPMLQWLHQNRKEGCTTYAMDWAALNGHLPVVQWLHHNRKEGCTKTAMNWAAEKGHLPVVEWLKKQSDEVTMRT